MIKHPLIIDNKLKYLKIYYKDLDKIKNLNKAELFTLLYLGKFKDKNNKVQIYKLLKQYIATELGFNEQTITNSIYKLVKKGLLERLDSSLYKILLD